MADNFTNKLGLQLYGNTEYDRAKKGFDWAQSINGNTQNSAFSKIDIWADYISKLVGSGTLYGGLTDCISAINSLNNTMQNTVQGVIVNGTELNKVNNKVSFTVPTKTSDITNDSHIEIVTKTDTSETKQIDFGDKFTFVKSIEKDKNGHITKVNTVNGNLPLITTGTVQGSGNVVSDINVSTQGIFTVTKANIDGHTHDNKTDVLDKLGVNSNNNLTFNGNEIGGSTSQRSCIVGQSSETTDNPLYKFASVNIESRFTDREIIFHVSTGFSSHTDKVGILKAHIRVDEKDTTTGLFITDSIGLKWEYVSKDINLEDFVLAYDDSNEGIVKVELWVRVNKPWLKYHFTVLQEGDLDKNYPFWTLYNKSSQGSEAEIPSNFTQVASTMITLKNDTIKSHTHDNKTQLDKIGENANGQITYNGQVISGGGGGTGSVDSVTVNGINYTPTDGVVTLPNYLRTYNPSTVGSGDAWKIGQYLDFHINGSTTDYDARLYLNDTGSFCVTDNNGSYAINYDIKTLYSEVKSLKNNVVNWKQPVVTAVNDKCSTSLTTETSGDDIATYISNIKTFNDITTGTVSSSTNTIYTNNASYVSISYKTIYIDSVNVNINVKSNDYFICAKFKFNGTPYGDIVYTKDVQLESNYAYMILATSEIQIKNVTAPDGIIRYYYYQ